MREAIAPANALLAKLPCIKEFCSHETANALLTKLPCIKEFCYHDVVDHTLDVVHVELHLHLLLGVARLFPGSEPEPNHLILSIRFDLF